MESDSSSRKTPTQIYFKLLIEVSMESERVDTRFLPRLVKENWNTEFKESSKEFALTCGGAGEIVITELNVVLRPPVREMRRLIPDPNIQGQFIDGNELEFPDDDRGDQRFEKYKNDTRT